MKCEKCKFDYPRNLLSAFRANKGTAVVCGICALELKNAVHGTNDTEFVGEIAEDMRQQAIAHRERE